MKRQKKRISYLKDRRVEAHKESSKMKKEFKKVKIS